MDLKLAKLPDRTPVKITIAMSPQLARKLNLYTELYNVNYPDNDESTADLIPYMLESFLEADRNFAKAFREREGLASPLGTNRGTNRTATQGSNPQKEE